MSHTLSSPHAVYRWIASAVGHITILLCAGYGLWSALCAPSPATLPPDSPTVTIHAPAGKQTPPRPFRAIPCVTTAPLTGTPCAASGAAK